MSPGWGDVGCAEYDRGMLSPLDAPLAPALGKVVADQLGRAFGFRSVGDLLSHYPRRYEERGELTEIDGLVLDENVTIVAEVLRSTRREMRARKGTILEVLIGDGHGTLTLTFFNQAGRAKELRPGRRGFFSGKITEYNRQRQLANPDYELFEIDAVTGADVVRDRSKFQSPLVPIYPATATMTSWKLRDHIETLLDALPVLDDPVPQSVRSDRKLTGFSRALELIHRPTSAAEWGTARKTLRFQEAFVLQSALLLQRERLRAVTAVRRVAQPGGLLERFDVSVPFTLTGDQVRVGEEITTDISSDSPMNRLVQGEVGSGKTLVALRGMLAVAESGGQSALLAPTEVLAGQHLRSIVKTLGPDLAALLRPTLITGQLPLAERRKATLAAVSGQSSIVIGTHALMSDNVAFFDLGLVVVDEQHRFGVEQREALRRKGATPPHVLVLTATPIPRTVAMTVFGDLDVSTIAELPVGRIPIESFVVPLAEKPGWVGRVFQRVAEEVAQGRQAFIVVPAIDPTTLDDTDDPVDDRAETASAPKANLTEVLVELQNNPVMAGVRIEPLHGRMPGEQKDQIMRSFAAGEIDVLVATTVIEVGVDVPNASIMVVLDADRFGVSQLHQLRGRVGRGSVPGVCLLVTHAELESLARERVEAVAATLDGFELAQKDLELRQEGNVLGTTQSGGRSSLRLLRVVKDAKLIVEARHVAAGILSDDPTLAAHPELRDALDRRLDEDSRDFLAKN